LGAVAAMAVSLAVPVSAGAQSLDPLGRPTEPVLQAMENLGEQQWIPEDTRGTIARLVGFFRGPGDPGTPLPENGPGLAQLPGPAELPVPGVPHGPLGSVLPAPGPEGVAARQAQPMPVDRLNIHGGRRGSTPLTDSGITAGGPATVTGLADTGAGQVLTLLQR